MIRSLILYHLYSGDVWFTAAVLLFLAVALDFALPAEQHSLARRALRIMFILSLPLAALAGVPLSLWLVALFLVVWTAYLLTGFPPVRRQIAVVVAAMLLIIVAVAVVTEIGWRTRGSAPAYDLQRILVFGDSLSSGGFGEVETWVERLDQRLPFELTNLSRPSATTGSALRAQLPEMEQCENCGVIIELGGNDMLGGGTVSEMEANLLELIEGVRRKGAGDVWLVELPIPPGRWSWGRAQRRVVVRTGVEVIPKRVLAAVLSDPDATSDGLHPTSRGHEILADRIAPLLD